MVLGESNKRGEHYFSLHKKWMCRLGCKKGPYEVINPISVIIPVALSLFWQHSLFTLDVKLKLWRVVSQFDP